MDQNSFNCANGYQLLVKHAAALVFMMLNPSQNCWSQLATKREVAVLYENHF